MYLPLYIHFMIELCLPSSMPNASLLILANSCIFLQIKMFITIINRYGTISTKRNFDQNTQIMMYQGFRRISVPTIIMVGSGVVQFDAVSFSKYEESLLCKTDSFSTLVVFKASSSYKTSLLNSKNFGRLYTIAKRIGVGSRKDFAPLKLQVEWHTLQYRSIDMHKVSSTDPTRPVCAKPNLLIKNEEIPNFPHLP